MLYSVDRLEEEHAVLLEAGGTPRIVRFDELGFIPGEGTLLKLTDGVYREEKSETERRRFEVTQLLEKLINKT